MIAKLNTELCINPYGEMEYIQQTIHAIVGLTGANITGLVCLPLDFEESWTGKLGRKIRTTKEKKVKLKAVCKEQLRLDIFVLGKNEEMDQLIWKCISFFA